MRQHKGSEIIGMLSIEFSPPPSPIYIQHHPPVILTWDLMAVVIQHRVYCGMHRMYKYRTQCRQMKCVSWPLLHKFLEFGHENKTTLSLRRNRDIYVKVRRRVIWKCRRYFGRNCANSGTLYKQRRPNKPDLANFATSSTWPLSL